MKTLFYTTIEGSRMKRIIKMEFVFLLSAVIIALPLLLAPANATTPVEVERIKDVYYFKINGHPVIYGWTDSEADIIYKNLSPSVQTVTITVKTSWFNTYPYYQITLPLLENEEIIIDEPGIAGDPGTIVEFWLDVTGEEIFHGTIRLPPAG